MATKDKRKIELNMTLVDNGMIVADSEGEETQVYEWDNKMNNHPEDEEYLANTHHSTDNDMSDRWSKQIGRELQKYIQDVIDRDYDLRRNSIHQVKLTLDVSVSIDGSNYLNTK